MWSSRECSGSKLVKKPGSHPLRGFLRKGWVLSPSRAIVRRTRQVSKSPITRGFRVMGLVMKPAARAFFACEELGTIFINLGRALSMRGELFPDILHWLFIPYLFPKRN